MVEESQLAASRSIHRDTGKTFYYATRLLPERIREATYVLYAFFRIADEVVDDPEGASPAAQRQRLREIRAAALGERPTDDPVLSAFVEICERYDVPDDEIEIFLDAMEMDVDKSRYERVEELEAYVRGSAGAVGVMMTTVMEPADLEAALPHARSLGDAFQLTNFLRDVGEDVAERDRIYLPRETLESVGAEEADLERGRFTPEIGEAIARELRRTERAYVDGVAGIQYLPRDCQLPVLSAAVLYADHHRLIRERDYDTVTETPSLGRLRKLSLLARTRWYWWQLGDPEAVFATVSGISTVDGRFHQSRPNDSLPMH